MPGIGIGIGVGLGGRVGNAAAKWAQEQWDAFAATDTYTATDEEAGKHVLAAIYTAYGGSVPTNTFLAPFMGANADLTAGVRALLHKDGIGTVMTTFNLTGSDFAGSSSGLASNGTGWVFTGYQWTDLGPYNQAYIYSGDGMDSGSLWHYGSRIGTSAYNLIASNSNTMTTLCARTHAATIFRPSAPNSTQRDFATAGFRVSASKRYTFYVDAAPEDYEDFLSDPGANTFEDSVFARPLTSSTADLINSGTHAWWAFRGEDMGHDGMLAIQKAIDEANGILGRSETGEAIKTYSILCAGDSLTWGQSDTGADWGGIGRSVSWPNAIRSKAPTLFPRPYADQGWEADDIAANPSQVQARLIDLTPRMAVLWAGNNDVNVGATAAAIQTDLLDIIDDIQTGGAKGNADTVVVLTITPRFNDTAGETTVKNDVNTWILNTLPGLRSDIVTYDVASEYSDPNDSAIYYDGVHFVVSVYDDIADSILSALQGAGANI